MPETHGSRWSMFLRTLGSAIRDRSGLSSRASVSSLTRKYVRHVGISAATCNAAQTRGLDPVTIEGAKQEPFMNIGQHSASSGMSRLLRTCRATAATERGRRGKRGSRINTGNEQGRISTVATRPDPSQRLTWL